MRAKSCAITSIVVDECRMMGLDVGLWRDYFDCPLDCPAGFVYTDFASGCPNTCQSRNASGSCELPVEPGCVCPDGTYLAEGGCLPEVQCGCTDTSGFYRSVSSFCLYFSYRLIFDESADLQL